MVKKFVIVSLFIGVLLFVGLYSYNNFDGLESITGEVIANEPSIINQKYTIHEEKEQESFEEKKSIGPFEREYETFDIVKVGDSSPAGIVFLYNLEPSNLRFPVQETMINFHPDKSYLGYDELDKFLEETNTTQLVIFTPDMQTSIEEIRKIGDDIGVGIVIKFARGAREDSDSENGIEALPFNFEI